MCGLGNNDTVKLPDNTSQYSYSSAWVGDTLTVTATAAPGFVFPGGKEMCIRDSCCSVRIRPGLFRAGRPAVPLGGQGGLKLR